MTLEKRPNEALLLEFNFARDLEVKWRPGRQYQSGNYVRPRVPNGFEYQCTNVGQSASREPNWPTTVSDTVVDGSAVWTCEEGANGTDTISGQSVTADAGLSVSGVTLNTAATAVTALVSGGSDGACYEVVCQVTTVGGETLELERKVIVAD